jgi:hypothetical protein
MADMQRHLARALMRAVGSQSVAVSIIDNGGDPLKVIAETRAALVDGLEGRPRITEQSCPRVVHRDWWTDGDDEDLDCPWCRIAALEGAPAESQQAS